MKPDDIAGVSEHSIQCALMAACAMEVEWEPRLAWLFAIPNGGDRDKRVAGNLKAEGVKAGVADLCLPVMARGYGGLWIEMKNEKGMQSRAQADFEKFVTSQGYLYGLFHAWRDAFNGIAWYLDYQPHVV